MNTARGSARPMRTLALSCLLASLLASCGITEKINESTRVEYKGTGKLAPLEVPPDLINPRGDDRFVVPDRQTADRSTYSGYQAARGAERTVAAESRVLPAVEGVRLERSGTQRWLVVNQPAERVWPVLRDFWVESGFALAIDSPTTGIMETEFLENRAKVPQDFLRRALGGLLSALTSTGERDSFRTRIESAPGGGTEIYLTHRGLSEEVRSQTTGGVYWKPRPADPELEAEFLQRLVLKLGAPAERARELAKAAAPAAAATRVTGATESAGVDLADGLLLPDSFDRAWRRVGLALDRAGFTVEDRDRSKGQFFVRYIDPDVASEKPGFFARLFSRSEAKSANAEQYRVQLDAEGTGSRLKVVARDGAALGTATDRQIGNKILVLLREQLVAANP